MQRVSRSSAVPSLPAPPASPGVPGFFTGGNPGLGQAATTPGYEWFNAVQEELMAVIARGGITGSNADLAQVRKSLDRLYGGAVRTVSANETLTADDAGMVLVDAAAGSRTITLPAANAVAGRPISLNLGRIDDVIANTVNLIRAGADQIDGNTLIPLPPGARLLLRSDGASNWRILSSSYGSGLLGRSLNAAGYYGLPGGLLLQWGTATLPASGVSSASVAVTFPIAFQNACRVVLPIADGPANSAAGGWPSPRATALTPTGCTIGGDTLGFTTFNQTVLMRYLAIGH
jgi:hypothetical protein